MKHIEINGKWIGERFRFGEVVIGLVHLDDQALAIAKENGLPEDEFSISVKGPIIGEPLEDRQWYRFFGRWTKYKNKRSGITETQFEFSTFVPARKHDREGIVSYLVKHGTGLGLGQATANKLFDLFGSETLREIRTNPDCIRKVSRSIRSDQCMAIQESLIRSQGIEDATVEVTNLLAGRRFPKTIPQLAIQTWGNLAAEKIFRNPYELMEFNGVGFGLTDRLYLDLGRRPTRIRRQLYCLAESLRSDNEGHVWFPSLKCEEKLKQTFGSMAKYDRVLELGNEYALHGNTASRVKAALSSIHSTSSVGSLDEFGSFKWIATTIEANIEESLATMIAAAATERQPGGRVTRFGEFETTAEEIVDHATCRRCGRQLTAQTVHVLDGVPYGPTCIEHVDKSGRAETHSLEAWLTQNPVVKTYIESLPTGQIEFESLPLWPEIDQIEDIDHHQRHELNRCLVGPVAVLGGRPGTGKTFTVARLIKSLVESGKLRYDEIGIGCPTGKAAVRLTEVMNAAGVPLRARTWHSMLIQAKRVGWHYKLLIGDESSMLDQSLTYEIFKARPKFCHVLLVGDVNQLPPVGRGAPFRDMIASGIPYGELTQIKRNSGGIVEACAAIVDGREWKEGDNLRMLESSSPVDSLEKLETIIDAIGKSHDPISDCQVLIAVNSKSELSKSEVNSFLQRRLNKSKRSFHGTFLEGDKVVCTKNSSYQEVSQASEGDRNERDEVFVANGELGRIVSIEQSFFLVELQSPSRLVKVPFGKQSDDSSEDDEKTGNGCYWDLGYAISCHRSQGSEWPFVVVMVDSYPGAKMVCSREWMNTAISRAKEKCFLIGKKAVANSFCRRQAINVRKTFLRERIGMELASKVLQEI